MSQQPPPYGSPEEPKQPSDQPYGQPYAQQQPYPNPYAQGPYPNPYGQAPQRSSKTTRNVLLVVGLVVVLGCAGIVGLGVLAVTSVSDSIDSSFDDEYTGSSKDPLVIEEGESFEIRGYAYGEGWSFTPNDEYDAQVAGLQVTDRDADSDSWDRPSIVFTAYDGNVALGQIDCRTPVELRRGKSAAMSCTASEAFPATYETLEVYDTATYE